MAILRIRDENGNIFDVPAIKGDKGDKGETGDVSVEMLNATKVPYYVDLLSTATVVDGKYIPSDIVDPYPSGSWKSYWIDVTNINEIAHLQVWGSTYIAAYAIAFYSSTDPTTETFIGGQLFTSTDTTKPNVFENIVVPDNAVLAVISNRKATSEEGVSASSISYDINHYAEKQSVDARFEDVQAELAAAKSETTVDLMTEENLYTLVNNGNCYAGKTGEIIASISWKGYSIPLGYNKYTVKCYEHTPYYLVSFYSSETPSASTLISGYISAGTNGTVKDIEFTADEIPDGTKTIFVSIRTAYGSDGAITAIETLNNRVDTLINDVTEIKNKLSSYCGKGNVKAIYEDVLNSNDFTIIKDEIWVADLQYDNGVATDCSTIRRYKIVDDSLVFISEIDSDFGHWNCVDYCEENDCLVFGNGANDFSTEGNYFTVVKNPLALGSVARIADCGIKYPVDIGFKVQAVWGDCNLGKNNIVYLISNNTQKITKAMLLRDTDGNFIVDESTNNGQYVVLETKELTEIIGVGGADFWGDTLYIGNGSNNFGLELMSMTDYSKKSIVKHCYDDDGTEYVLAIQGVHVDSDYVWVFTNLSHGKKYLIQYYR